jgi:hypothetical protein
MEKICQRKSVHSWVVTLRFRANLAEVQREREEANAAREELK